MRIALAIAVLAASASSAHAAEDRYGSKRTAPPDSAAVAATLQPYAGAMLGWSGKSAAPTPQAALPSTLARPALMPGGLYRSAPPPQAPVAAAAPASAGYASAAPKDGRWHTIEVRVKKGKYLVRARRGFIAT